MKIKNKKGEVMKEKIDLQYFGKYRLGLTKVEIVLYLRTRSRDYSKHKKMSTKALRKKFNKTAGVNTMAIVDNQVLMYRHDVERFADVLFLGKETYFD